MMRIGQTKGVRKGKPASITAQHGSAFAGDAEAVHQIRVAITR
jgi:hypothetical protein